MEFFSHVALLVTKNLIVIWRSKLWFLCEMLLGFLMLPLIAYIVSQAHTDINHSLSYEPVSITGDVRDLNRLVKVISRINHRWCVSNQSLAYTANNPLIDKLMEEVFYRYDHRLIVNRFDNLTLMLQTLRNDLNSSAEKLCGKYLGGVDFQSVGSYPPHLTYKFYFPQRIGSSWNLNSFWLNDGPYAASPDINSIPASPEYWSSGFLSIQFSIESTFLELMNKTLDFDVLLQRMPTPEYRNNGVVAFLKATPILWSLLVLLTMLHTVKNVVNEKEVGIKTYMMVMGLNPMAFYASHFLIGFLKVLPIILICTGIFSTGFYVNFSIFYPCNISPTMFLVFSICYAFNSLLFALLISVIFRRSTVALTLVLMSWICLIVIDSFTKHALNEIGYCFIVSLNFFSAFKLGVKSASTFEARLMDLGWMNMFSDSDHLFTFGMSFFMLIFNGFWISFLIYYLDSVIPTDGSPRKHPFFIFSRFMNPTDRTNCGNDDMDSCTLPSENFESELGLNIDEADINISRMSKNWESTGQRAVDNLNFRAFRGQVTVLLGHNGAGKSTTFSVISGAASISSGDIFICGTSINENLHICQKQIGYCPQYNPLFPKLTVREHLKLYAKLKCGNSLAKKLNQAIESLADDVQLKSKLDIQTQFLSGGMKRKLCVAMALIGDSRVVLLDEPTAGMDPEARHDIRVILEKAKKNRTILLTTHYMDEADSLGDRIGIMVKGRLVCNGSPEFLKNKFGTGYILSIATSHQKKLFNSAVEPQSDILLNLSYQSEPMSFNNIINRIMHIIRKHVHEIRIENIQPPEFSLIIPVKYKKFFADMFDELENRKIELGIDSFGLSFNTLEQVFLKVGESAGKEDNDEADCIKIFNFASDLFQWNGREPFILRLWIYQIMALLKRHYFGALRNKIRTLLPIVLSLLLFIAFGFGTKIRNSNSFTREFGLRSLQSLSIPIQLPHSGVPPSADFPFIVGHIPNAHLISVPSVSELQNFLIGHAYDSPPLGIGVSVYRNNTESDRDSVYALFNGVALHSIPSSLLLISNAMLKNQPDSINMFFEVYTSDNEDSLQKILVTVGSNAIVAIIVIILFSSLTSMFVMSLIEDNQSKFKHQMLLTKLNVIMYWISVLFWFAFLYIVFCLMLGILFSIFGWMQNCVTPNIAIWALYFWSCVPFICCASFIFDSSTRAFAALMCWNVVMSIFALVFIKLLQAYVSETLENFSHKLSYIFLPSYALSEGMIGIATLCSLNNIKQTDYLIWDALESSLVICMILSGAIFWTILFLLQSKTIAFMWHKFSCHLRNTNYKMVHDESKEDDDVIKERIEMRDNEDMTLTVCELYKYYSNFCAIKNLTFGVRQTDCFGLLGVNGAGKTSTFDILTGVSFASSGNVTVNGVNIINSPLIGYCPQFDALPFDLTGREVLLLLAHLNGFNDADDRVEKILWSVRMSEEGDKLVQYYSGGQKRRLSIGITLISRASLIMLDEPTAGIDPKTRRCIWQLLLAVRKQNIAILLTSHSMEECEALCNRIGFMNKGTLISIGSSQHLKSKYGNSFMLTFTIANPNPSTFHILNSLAIKEFQAKPTQDSSFMSTLHWEIPKHSGPNSSAISWSQLFRKAQIIAETYTKATHLPPGSETPVITDFSITQNSLEQVFLRLAEVSAGNESINV